MMKARPPLCLLLWPWLGALAFLRREAAGLAPTLLVLLALLALALALGGFSRLLHRLPRDSGRSLWIIYGLAYILPLGVYLGLLGLTGLPLAGQVPVLGQPWLYLWQGLALLLVTPLRVLPRAMRPALIRLGALAVGLGLGVMAALGHSLLLAFIPGWADAPTLPPGVLAVYLGFALLITPWVEGYFFRGRLLDYACERWGAGRAVWLSAGLFALGLGRPLLWLPGLILGWVLALMARRTRSWEVSAWAHLGINLILGGLGWYLLV